MRVEVNEELIAALAEYAHISIAFEVSMVFDITKTSYNPGKFVLTERRLDAPYVKDYDAIEGEHPTQWAKLFDVTNWGLFAARMEGRRIGGAVVAYDTPGLDILEGRGDMSVLWDIRVALEARGRRRFRALQGLRSVGHSDELPATQSRDPEHQRRGVQVLRAAGMCTCIG